MKCCNGKDRGTICSIYIPRLKDESFPFRILEIDGNNYQIGTESLHEALKDENGEIRSVENISIDNQFAYYVPDICIYLPNEDLASGIESILNGGDAEMYIKVEDNSNIDTFTRYYKDLAEFVVAENINNVYNRLLVIRNDNPTKISYKEEKIVISTVKWIEEEVFGFEKEPEGIIKNPKGSELKICICFGKYPKRK